MSTARWTAAGATAAALALLLFPVLRPWPDETVATTSLALGFASDRWVVAHLCGILGLGLLAPTLLGLRSLLTRTGTVSTRPAPRSVHRSPAGPATAAVVTAWAGAGLSSLYFGAETFGIRTIAQAALRTGDLTLLDEVTALREQPVALATFGAGLLLVAAAGVLTAVAVWRTGPGTRWAGIPVAIALALFVPQFYGGPGVRIAYGVLVAAALLVLAAATLSLGNRLSVRGSPAGRDA